MPSTRSDARHSPFKTALEDYWREEGTGLDMPWSAGDAGALAAFLKANPSLTEVGFRRLLAHRFHSEDHAEGEPPRIWVGALTRYAKGPLDRFKLPQAQRRQTSDPAVGVWDGKEATPVQEDRSVALSYWRLVKTKRPDSFRRDAPAWAKRELTDQTVEVEA